MWRKVGELFDKVQGINIGTVNCDEEGQIEAWPVPTACSRYLAH
jgi:hypothetical protein